MAYKLSFRFEREDHTIDRTSENNDTIRTLLYSRLDKKEIVPLRMYTPSRNSIKVLFKSDEEVNKILQDTLHFTSVGLHPKISMTLKASRTVFCIGFDHALLSAYNKELIEEHLKSKGWEIVGVYIMKHTKAIKIEFPTSKQANIFLKNTNTSIGAFKLLQEHKEREVDPTINQCWECGVINPDHNTKNCQGLKICLKCGSTDHKFYNCRIPRKNDEMTDWDKQAQYCIPCRAKGNHTSIDHSRCPKKREIIQERARVIREKRKVEINTNCRDLELIKSVLDYSNNTTWPTLQHTATSTIISLALLDEAINPGTFQNKLKKGCEENGIPAIKYTIERNTATEFFNTMCGAMSQNREVTQVGVRIQAGTSSETYNQGETKVQDGTHTETLSKQHRQRQYTQKRTQSTLPQFKILHSQIGGKEAQQIYTEIEKINNYIEGNGTLGEDMPRRDTPHKIKINTHYTRNKTTQDRCENNQGAAALTPETLRNYQSPDTIEIPETWRDLDIDSTSQSLDDSYLEQQIEVEEFSDIDSDSQYLLLTDQSKTEDNTQQSVCELCNKSCNKSYKIGDSYKFGHQFVCETCYKYHNVAWDNYNKHIKICKCKGVICICKGKF